MTAQSSTIYSTKHRPVTPPKLHHATFMTVDVAKMVQWYELVAGMQPIYYAEHAAWLTNDDANHRIALLRLPGTKIPVDKPHTAGLHHTAFEYPNFDLWLDNYIRLRDQGIVPAVNLHHGMTMSMYYVDPDGNGVEIQVDVWGDWLVSKEWMWASQEFADDQIGAPFDPEKLVQAREQGMGMEEMQKRTYAREYLPEVIPSVNFPDVWPARIAAEPNLVESVPSEVSEIALTD